MTSPQADPDERGSRAAQPKRARRGPLRLLARTLQKAWDDSIFSEAAEAAFWQTLSLPPLLLGLLGSLGFVADWLGPEIIQVVQTRIIELSGKVFTPNVVDGVIGDTVTNILTKGRGEIVSVGFLISLWAGSSATASFVDAITVAHGQYGARNLVWQRVLSLLLYLVTLVLLIIGLPVLALGPELLPEFFPDSWKPTVSLWVDRFYYPGTGLLLVLALATLYKVALPRKLPWHRGLPGAALAMAVFLLSSVGLRLYISWVTSTGFTYGALATPIAFLLFAFFIGFAIVLGAHFNAAIQELWPARQTRRERRRWRRLEMARTAEKLRSQAEQEAWATAAAKEAADRRRQAVEAELPPVASPADENPTVRVPRQDPGGTTEQAT
ncbi:membrane protein [Crossiella equi]|uniref:Membrane protein n=1 Tax=Crossiella equi TaxID=130796 RepID=A0ABS5AB84_9PSEU|nr:YihY/virulence factor BrkB family protein [Crossiella equi]MBP2473552.1 membrane protein [Crossiella equi]